MKFWGRRSGSRSTASIERNGSSTSLNSSFNNGGNGVLSRKASSISTPTSQISSTSLPSRKQRMLLLKCIIHHADAVQKQYLVPKQLPSTTPKTSSTIDNMSSIFIRADTVTAEINDKCYQRWHQVLQEGLVPMSVHALNLLEKTATTGGGETLDDEEEAYFATMEGMDEEIQVMCILARAAALDNLHVGHGGKGCANDKENCAENSDGMDQINDMMKCAAMLLFHVVLAASTPGSPSSGSTKENTADATKNETTVAGYDGRVRHVMKLACVDVLTHAILESVESYCNNNVSINSNEKDPPGLNDVDEYSLWNIANIKSFLDQTDLGKDAIFGTPFKPSSGTSDTAGGKKSLAVKEEGQQTRKKQQKRRSQRETDDQTVDSEDMSKQSQSKSSDQVSTSGEMPPKTIESTGSNDSFDSSSSLEVHQEENKYTENESLENNHQREDIDYNESNQTKTNAGGDNAQRGSADVFVDNSSEEELGVGKQQPEANNKEQQNEALKELRARRQFNAKFLATRKFELIERLVAIDIVRFLMAEEREKKLHEKELKAQRGNALSSLLKKGSSDLQDPNNDESTVSVGDSNADGNVNASSEQITNTSSQIFTAYRVNQIKRGAKIAGCGLALGTVFAITGGLAAPALAAGIGGIAALTGASTASSAAVLAVLATFKAGAALFGVGGGGLAAYKMKKRTAGLSQFEIRRENVEQYMYAGASDEKMKKGIESMLPQLHTTIVVSGWLRHNDTADFQLAWGIQPTNKYDDPYDHQRRIRQMKRFYAIYNPPLVFLCESFMRTLQKRLKKDFSWDRIWISLEQKYGANPDHMIPIDTPHENEVFLSYEEREMIDGVLNNAKIINMRKQFGHGDGIDFNDSDEISELLARVSPESSEKVPKKNTMDSETELDMVAIEHELVTMQSGQSDGSSDRSVQMNDQSDRKKRGTVVKEIEMSTLSVRVPGGDGDTVTPGTSPSLQERMATQGEQQVSFLKDKGVIHDKSNLQEGDRSPKIAGADSDSRKGVQSRTNEDIASEEYDDERSPVVWDWKRLYGTADIHTVTWETQMLSSLCHIVENMALEVSQQATKVALSYSVIGAIVTAVAIPSALITASKLIDDPYQIMVIRADEAGKELAKCLLMSDERRPVTLVGFSFGARVVYSCLRELARQQDIWEENRVSKSEESESGQSSFLSKKSKDENRFEYDREPASLVGDVIFIGLPRAIDKKVLTSCRRVTGGRLVNCYTTNDWLLSLMFVARGGTPCGTKPIKDVPGVENYDITHLVESHTKYGDAIPNILQHIRFAEP